MVNDIGPLPAVGGSRPHRLVLQLQRRPTFMTSAEAEAYFREVSGAVWRSARRALGHITRHSVAWHPESRALRHALRPANRDAPFAIPGTTASISGNTGWRSSSRYSWYVVQSSDLLTAELAEKMERRSVFAKIHVIEGCGHAPPLMSPDQIKLVSDFLAAQDP